MDDRPPGGEAGEPYDLLVIGAGVNGAGIARDAAGRGLKVLLCEKGDIGEGTSSRSGKLVHGGLRYLEYYEFRLVREALIEREVLLNAAPHIIWPMRFVLPHAAHLRPAWMVRLGLFLYDHLGGRRKLPPCRSLDLRTAPEGAALKPEYTRGFEYSDCWVDDARLVVLNCKGAEDLGARILTRTACVAGRREGELWSVTLADQLSGASETVQARVLINAAGPWVDRVLGGALGHNSPNRVRLVKGSHIVVPKIYEGNQAYLFQNADRRVIFVNPYEGRYLLIGTTDIPYEGNPDTVVAGPDEVAYLCEAVSTYFLRRITPDDVVYSFSGVRPLYDDTQENPSAVTRDYVFDIDGGNGRPPLLSVFGGKITTYRKLAEHALEKLQPHLASMGGAWTRDAPLPGGDMPDADFEAFAAGLKADYPWLGEDLAWHYGRLYGTQARSLLGDAGRLADLGHHFGAGLHEREVLYLMNHEWAITADDILWRRTKFGLHMTEDERAGLARWLEGSDHGGGIRDRGRERGDTPRASTAP